MCCSRTQEVGGTLVIDLWSIDLPANGVPQAEVSSRAQATRPPVVGSRPVGATQPPIPWERHSLPERVAEGGGPGGGGPGPPKGRRPPVVGSRPVGATQPPIPWERHSLPERVAEEGPASLARMRPLSPPECRET